jgi:hypothetical protein
VRTDRSQISKRSRWHYLKTEDTQEVAFAILQLDEDCSSGKTRLSIDGWALDKLNGINRQRCVLLMQFETEFAQDREN